MEIERMIRMTNMLPRLNRDQRVQAAEQTVAICTAGRYIAPSGLTVKIADEIKRATDGTQVHTNVSKRPSRSGHDTVFEVTGETTFDAIQRLSSADSGHLACLNFASAKNPGGGFLSGAQAQEEALSRASALYPCLLTATEYYSRNRANKSALYLDNVIYSPLVPFFRDDLGELIEEPKLCSVLTAPAPNAGAIAQNEPHNLDKVAPTLLRRAEWVLSVAANYDLDTLILGAWGCGVFRNDPEMVASTFKTLLCAPGEYAGVYKKVVFAVFDPSREQPNLSAFTRVFQGTLK